MRQYRTHSYEETKELGGELGSKLTGGEIICLKGNLGTGKTAFTGGIASALGISGHITSPTFTLINEYESKIPLYHFDVYRLSEPDEMFEIGFEEYLYNRGVVVIEWADMIKDILPGELIWVEIKKDIENGQDERIITIDFRGERYKELDALLPVDS